MKIIYVHPYPQPPGMRKDPVLWKKLSAPLVAVQVPTVTVARRRVTVVKIHCPVAPETLAALLAGDAGALERDPTAAAMLGVIRADNALGDFGLYHGVAEIGLGWESFTPSADAVPTLGVAGASALSSSS